MINIANVIFDKSNGGTITNNGLTYYGGTITSALYSATTTFTRSEGKYYWEYKIDSLYAIAEVGIIESSLWTNTLNDAGNAITYRSDENGSLKRNLATTTPYGSKFTTGDVIGVYLDIDNGVVEFFKNGISQGVAFSGLQKKSYAPLVSVYLTNTKITANFGDSEFLYPLTLKEKGAYSFDGKQTPPLPKILIRKSDGVYVYYDISEGTWKPLGHEPTDEDFLNLGVDNMLTKVQLEQLVAQVIKGRVRKRRL